MIKTGGIAYKEGEEEEEEEEENLHNFLSYLVVINSKLFKTKLNDWFPQEKLFSEILLCTKNNWLAHLNRFNLFC